MCAYCYEYPVYYPGYCSVCVPPPCPECSIMTMTTPYHPRPPRPSTLPGLTPLTACRGRHDSPSYAAQPPILTTPVHMHPDPQYITHQTGFIFIFLFSRAIHTLTNSKVRTCPKERKKCCFDITTTCVYRPSFLNISYKAEN